MHWIKLKDYRLDGNKSYYINLDQVQGMQHTEDELELFLPYNEKLMVHSEDNIASVLARLEALSEIATHRTVANLPALNEEE